MGDVVEFGQLALVRLSLGLPLVGSESVVEMVEHLCLVQRQHDHLVLLEPVSFQPPSGRRQLSLRCETEAESLVM